jgi:UDP-3-O-[3-hydroxymyristoyl] glucosamine N-acyltransferase
MRFTIFELARLLDGEIAGDAGLSISGIAAPNGAKAGDLTFAENAEYFATAEKSAASAIIAGKNASSATKTLIRVATPRVAFAKALAAFFPEPKMPAGIHPSSVIAASAQIDSSAHIGPHCTIGERVKIGANCVLLAGNFVGDDSVLEADVKLSPHVTLYPRTHAGKRVRIHAGSVIGSDGFGYVLDAGAHRKIPQVGNVVIGDDVEIGANVSIDRGALGSTVIGRGTKIDNLVQVGHNVEIGEHSILCGQSGIAGSAKLGRHVILAGQSGLAGHIKLGDHAVVGAQSGVMTNIPAGGKYLGTPAQPDKDFKRQAIAIRHLPDLLKEVAEWKKKLSGE